MHRERESRKGHRRDYVCLHLQRRDPRSAERVRAVQQDEGRSRGGDPGAGVRAGDYPAAGDDPGGEGDAQGTRFGEADWGFASGESVVAGFDWYVLLKVFLLDPAICREECGN